MHKYSATRKAGIAGVSGYSGRELLRILGKHPGIETVEIPREGEIASIVESQKLDVVFLATPHEVSMDAAPAALAAGARVIDLSGAFRLKDPDEYQQFYKTRHTNTGLLSEAVYGLPELNRNGIPSARLIANPGCYATVNILALAPLLDARLIDLNAGIVCDSKSGVSGAGHKPTPGTHFCAVHENFRAYGILDHRHIPEMLQALGLGIGDFSFAAHLLPVDRGILTTIYVKLSRIATLEEIHSVYGVRYPPHGFVRIRNRPPDLNDVQRTNCCDIHVTASADGRRLAIVAAIDNLVKGAAGQAVQNMNLMLGFAEDEGLK